MLKPIRKLLATVLAKLAMRLYPQNEEVIAFMADRMAEAAITGSSFIKITVVEDEHFFKNE